MIRLTRLNGIPFVLNCEWIQCIEAAPDTIITLTQGNKLMVRETLDFIIQATIDYRKKLYQEPMIQKDLGV